MKMIHAAIFDMDGTLLDSGPMWNEVAPETVRRFGGNRGRASTGICSRWGWMTMLRG